MRFTDVTAESHINVTGYAMGVAAADFDNDGCVDLFVTAFGHNQLFRNGCDGTFTDVTKAAASMIRDGPCQQRSRLRPRWLAGSVRRQLRPLFAGCEQTTVPRGKRATGLLHTTGIPGAAGPAVSKSAERHVRRRARPRPLVGGHFGPALGVSTADFDNDGWVDIFVANDGEANQLWLNQRDGTFKDAAFAGRRRRERRQGTPKGSMGVDAGDFDNDGDEDLFITDLPGEGNNLYVNDGSGIFEDQSTASRPGPRQSRLTPALAPAGSTYDNDGWLDLLTVNGAVIAQSDRGGPRSVPVRPNESSCFAISGTGGSRTSPARRAACSGCPR